MKNPKISVIVPVYKVEKYLKRCVDSILAQTYTNFELILVDDGSPDTCPAMCDEFAMQDNRIRVVHKKNGGLSDARNAGIDIATGEYIAFVDSDDYIAVDMCEQLLESILKYNADVAFCNYLRVDEAHNIGTEREQVQPIRDECLSQEQVWQELLRPYGGYYIVAWNKLYHRKLFDSLRFPVGKQHEDEFVIHHVINQCNKIACVSKPLYFYVQRAGSIMAQQFSVKNMDYGEALIDRYHFAKSIRHTALKNYCAGRLSYELEKWKSYAETDEKCRIKYDELRKQSRFLLYEKAAWDAYSIKGKTYHRLELLVPGLAKTLRRFLHRDA